MCSKTLISSIFILALWTGSLKHSSGSILFHLGFGINFGLNNNTFGFNFGESDSNELASNEAALSTYTATEAPILATSARQNLIKTNWSRLDEINDAAENKLLATRLAVQQLNHEISPIVGRSDYIAGKVKLTTRYLNEADTGTASTHDAALPSTAATKRFIILQHYVQLVDALRQPPSAADGGTHSAEYLVMKLSLEKYKLFQLQNEILFQVIQAMEMWQNYVKTKTVDVAQA